MKRALCLVWLVGCSKNPTSSDLDSAPPTSDPKDAVETQRLVDDMTTIAGPRRSGSSHWQSVQDLCASRLESLGFTVERQAFATGVNVIGVREGTSAERVVVSAHYDSTDECSGADDNASGVAGALEVARVLAARSIMRTLVVACWDQEELGLLGSSAWVERARAAADAVVASYVFEMIGYRSSQPGSQRTEPGLDQLFPRQAAAIAANGNRGDFVLVIHDEAAARSVADFEASARAIGLPTIVLPVPESLKKSPVLSPLRRSDHAPFWFADFPAVQLTDTANYRNPHYHCGGGDDAMSDIDIEFATANVRATVGAIASALDQL